MEKEYGMAHMVSHRDKESESGGWWARADAWLVRVPPVRGSDGQLARNASLFPLDVLFEHPLYKGPL